MPRFLCDEMLRGLGRWLRAAGYDTVIAADGLPDRALAARCAAEGRILLTKDRDLAATAAGTAPVFDNRPLEVAPPDSAARVPERSRAAGGPLRVCPECGRLYWPGGHVRQMRQRLAAWQRERAGC